MRVLSRLFRRLFLEKLVAAHQTGQLHFFADHTRLTEQDAFADYLEPLRKIEWVVYAKRPFAGPDAVLAYLSRYTHRVAISNSRLIRCDEHGVTFKWKDYRAKGKHRQKLMTLATDEFIRRFLLHILPHGFHRIRHYGLFANSRRAGNLALARQLINMPTDQAEPTKTAPAKTAPDENADENADERRLDYPCPECGGAMVIIERFEAGAQPRAPPPREAVAA